MQHKQRLWLLIINMTTVSLVVASIGIFSLYQISFRQQEERLQEILDSEIRLINAIVNQEATKNLSLKKQEENTLKILQNANQSCKNFAKTGQINLAKKEDNLIIYLLTNCNEKFKQPVFIDWKSKFGVPSRAALKGESGTTIDLDYRGVKVLAAYQPIEKLKWGIVAKIDLVELRSPFIRITIYTAIIGLIINSFGASFFIKLTYPMLKKLEKSELDNRNINKQLQQEIIERSNIENALQQEINILAKIMELNQVGIVLVNPQGKIILASGKAEQILGLSKEEMSQLSPNDPRWDLRDYDGNVVQENDLMAKKILETKQPIYDQIRTLNLDQKGRIFLSINAAPIFDHQEQIKGVLYAFEDITQQLLSQKELSQREAQFRAIFEKSVLGIALLNLAGKIIKTNNSLQIMLDYAEEELLNLDFQQTICSYEQNNQEFQAVINGEIEFHQSEKRFFCKNGNSIWGNLIVSLIKDSNNKGLFIVAIIEDITQRKQSELDLQESEQKYRNMIETAHEGVWIIDNNNKTTFVNQRMLEMLGYQEEEMLGKELLYFTDEQGKKMALANIERRRQGIKEQHEFKFIHKDGREIWTLIATNPLFDSAKNYTGALGLLSDITEHKIIEKALQKTNEKLKQYVKELQAHNRERDLLNRLNEFIQACVTVREAYGVLGDLLAPLFPDCSGAVFIINNSNTLVEAVTIWGENSFTEKIFSPAECWGLRHGYIHLSNQAYHSLFCPHTKENNQPNISLCLPMMAQSKSIGLLYLACKNNHAIDEHKQQFARTVAENISLNIANLQLRESLHQSSIRDALTGLFNRRYLEESLERELYLAQRKKYTVGVIMIDIDHFKRFNDTFGHDAGDYVLKEVAKVLKNDVRKGDIACRYGGEELTIIMPEVDLNHTFNRAEQIRQQIEQLELKHHEQLLGQITASFGVACYPEDGKTLEKVLQIADNYLYQAKKQGRNCVIKSRI